ncbi:MAG: bifunctional methylenetetrahydrofolate dehydrogenase/methenyltetrahydrofolate cyclohydrolase FolD [Anaerolineaceae bacterium]|nr:bifunctional methylenetetrahydrofolate dehydrogenase/methenyltetrahydrofolate cyclohydrolase FolD [Anaerolineaceae bacterium]
MTARIIDGKMIAARIRAQIRVENEKRLQMGKQQPGLATVLVGDAAASQSYVRMKHRACEEVGFQSYGHQLDENATQTEVETIVRTLNDDPKVHGILVQLPLPQHLDENAILDLISVEKDVDGIHPLNIGRLAQKGREPRFVACTPAGVMVLIHSVVENLSGLNAVVLGRSNIVGMPVALLLIAEDATVTVCHSRTKDLAATCASADILVAAVGRREIVKADWIKPGAVVIDVGTNRVDDPGSKRGYRLTGDVAFEEVKEIAGAISPSPGGVGPMTIAMLLKNTLHSAQLLD